MAPSDQMLKSQACKVRFAGWESTTTRLQNAGWQLAVEHAWDRDRVRLAMKYRDGGMRMIAEAQHYTRPMHFDAMRYEGMGGAPNLPVFDVIHVAPEIHIRVIDIDTFNFSPIDARTQIHTITDARPMDAFEIFAVPLVKTEEIIVEPASVMELMEQIKKLQAPELAAIRERQRRAERGEPLAQTRYHAQIISLAA